MPEDIFKLSPQEQELTERLKRKIVNCIGDTFIPVSRYVELALYEKNDGYYTNLLHKFGTQGDFVTAPVVSGLFGGCIALQIRQLWAVMQIASRNILEIGAGNGQLMLDLLLQLNDEIECYYIVELSANLVNLQQQLLQSKASHLLSKVKWLNSLPEDFLGVILANEVLDAQPSEVVVWENGVIKQQVVCVNQDNNLVYATTEINSPELLTLAQSMPVNADKYVSEISLNNRGFVKALADILDTGFILLIDYGYSNSEYYSQERTSGTLRAFFRQHMLEDILHNPGLIDITTSVDFTAIAITAQENNLDLIGYTTQANFLLNCGLLELLASQKGNDADYYKLVNQVKYLTLPEEMGEVFKVIGFSKNIEFCDWMGFSSNDRSHTL